MCRNAEKHASSDSFNWHMSMISALSRFELALGLKFEEIGWAKCDDVRCGHLPFSRAMLRTSRCLFFLIFYIAGMPLNFVKELW